MSDQNKYTNKEVSADLNEIPFGGKHWTNPNFISPNVLIDALSKHILGLSTLGMADVGEVLDVLCRLKGSNEEIWINAWSEKAQLIQNRAEDADKKGRQVTASTAYLRAATYWRCALLYYSNSGDPRIKEYALKSIECYERYLKLSGYPGESIKIPYEDSYLPGYFYKSPVAGDKAPLLIVTPGRDTWANDIWAVEGAVRRGIHCLICDGPGQGFALRLNNLTFRNDWENVVSPIIDFALEKYLDIDTSRIALMGMSMGGYLISRAAAFDKRIKLLIPNPGNIRWGEGFIKQLQSLGGKQPHEIPEEVRNMVKDYAWKHGVPNTIKDVAEVLEKYNNSDIIDQITCETIVLDGTAEVFDGAKPYYDALKCPKTYYCFDETTSAQCHGQTSGYAAATEILFDLIEERL